MWLKKFLFFIIVFSLSFLGLYSTELELLKASDVGKVMHQIFEQHVDKKEMSSSIIKNSFRIYIDQFDPHRMYLLEEEVAPYLQMSDAQLEKVIQQYRYNDFSTYTKLNEVIQKAIFRARILRQEVMTAQDSLFGRDTNSNISVLEDPDLKIAFVNSPELLKKRIKERFVDFIQIEKERFGETQVLKNKDKALALYDNYLRGQENGYLFVGAKEASLTAEQKENLFILHVLKSLANSLDAHTAFFNNAEAYDMKMRLEKAFEGIGVVLQQRADGGVIIKKMLEGGPAEKSGQVHVNDQILTINGQSTKDLSLETIMEKIRGENGSAVSLQLEREQEENGSKVDKKVDVSLKREPIAINEDRVDVSYDKFGDGIIGKITLHAFYQGENGITSENDVRKAIKDLSQKGSLKGLILDLRENSGGFLTQAVKVSGIFITNGVVVISKYSNGTEHFYRDMDGKMGYSGPLIVLTSKATASAAEIVAQALQDYGVALVVGDERTYGKGSIQSQTITDDKAVSYFKVTVGKYYTVSGKTPQIKGVLADIVVPGPYNSEHIGEQYLDYALKADTIDPEFKDDLRDVDAGLKPWYLRYYTPTIQIKIDDWKTLVPLLKKNSALRIENNKNYQAFLKHLKVPGAPDDKNFGNEDLQMAEAVQIIKDMISLHQQIHIQYATNP